MGKIIIHGIEWGTQFSDNPLARFNEVANVYSFGEAYRRFYKMLIVSRWTIVNPTIFTNIPS